MKCWRDNPYFISGVHNQILDCNIVAFTPFVYVLNHGPCIVFFEMPIPSISLRTFCSQLWKSWVPLSIPARTTQFIVHYEWTLLKPVLILKLTVDSNWVISPNLVIWEPPFHQLISLVLLMNNIMWRNIYAENIFSFYLLK